ncbi:hypothetical protein Tsubulata_015097 [Turnera subulata]|uniref:Peptide chain release factor domain-containing protein n=1 Tax=Turnera subulata TaxID=218843 RepID=A0A9Q0GAM3_9ROSI|nr:hypothetical protein Tsubulata_015097 [Turnera subulata]
MAAEYAVMNTSATANLKFHPPTRKANVSLPPPGTTKPVHCSTTTPAPSHSMDTKNHAYKQLGLFSLKKKIEDTIAQAEMLEPALELEQARCVKQETNIRGCNLWNDPVKSNEILGKLADSVKVVDALKDLKYKLEEAKLISQLADKEVINYQLFKEAYSASVDVSKFLCQYGMSKLLKGPYDLEGACVIIQAGEGVDSKIWTEELQTMYMKWAKKLGCGGRVVEKNSCTNGGIHSATIEFEYECAYGYLSGERGIHYKINSPSGSVHHEVSSACVDVVPLFLGTVLDVQFSDDDLIIASPLCDKGKSKRDPAVLLEHIPTGISVQSSGERSSFANKMKALNRLKAKLLVTAEEQKVWDVREIRREHIMDVWKNETRRYVWHPHKLVQDLKTGIHLPDLNSVLNGNIEALIEAHINLRNEQ